MMRMERKKSFLTGTASLINIDGINYVITAKHVVCDITDKGKVIKEKSDLYSFVKGKQENGKVIAKKLREKDEQWLYHKNDEVDLVIIPFTIDKDNCDILSLPTNFFINQMMYTKQMKFFYFLSTKYFYY